MTGYTLRFYINKLAVQFPAIYMIRWDPGAWGTQTRLKPILEDLIKKGQSKI